MANLGHGGNAKEISREKNINYEDIIDFSANINPLGISEKVKKSICDNLSLVEKYPDISYYELKKAIGQYENVNYEDLILGNGAAEVLFNIIRTINPRKTLILAPTFSEYEEAVKSIGGEVVYYYLKEENKFDIKEDYLKFINEDIDMLIICNPNNPTGNIFNSELIFEIIKKAKINNVKVILDESFLDFTDEQYSVKKYINDFNNLIIVKSLTKFFAIPGLRIGYGICKNKNIINNTNKITPAWNINILAEKAAITSLNDVTYINKTKEYINKEKQYLYEEMLKIKSITVFKPAVNFIFFKVNNKMDLFTLLIKDNILVRSCKNYNGLDERYYRIGVKNRKNNVMLINILKKILE